MKAEEKDRRSRILLIAIISGLFILNGWLIFSLINKDKRLTETEVQNEELEEEVSRLDLMLDEAEAQLLEYKGKNETLDSIVDERDRIIANKVAQIRAMLRNENLTKEQLSRAEQQIRTLNGLIATYKNQLDTLRAKNKNLQDEIAAKDEELDSRAERIGSLETSNAAAEEKIRIASRLEALDINAIAVRGSKEKETSKLSRAEKIRVTFKLGKNEIAEKGSKTVYLKIITPSKATLHNEEAGSGKFTYLGEESLYTAKQKFNFANSNEKLTFYWLKSAGMIAGDYEAYLFCEDHIIGKTGFSLK